MPKRVSRTAAHLNESLSIRAALSPRLVDSQGHLHPTPSQNRARKPVAFFPIEELRPYRDALEAFVKEELSMYYLTLEVAQATFGLRIAVPSDVWAAFRAMSVLEFTDALQEMAKKMKKHKYTKHKRGPKKKAPKKLSGKRYHHQSTAKLIGKRKQL
jgi:hypothetical protein